MIPLGGLGVLVNDVSKKKNRGMMFYGYRKIHVI